MRSSFIRGENTMKDISYRLFFTVNPYRYLLAIKSRLLDCAINDMVAVLEVYFIVNVDNIIGTIFLSGCSTPIRNFSNKIKISKRSPLYRSMKSFISEEIIVNIHDAVIDRNHSIEDAHWDIGDGFGLGDVKSMVDKPTSIRIAKNAIALLVRHVGLKPDRKIKLHVDFLGKSVFYNEIIKYEKNNN